MLILQNITYTHPDKDVLFENIQFRLGRHQKAALIGDNGSGKSTLLEIMAGLRTPLQGEVAARFQPYYVPQLFGQYNGFSVARALQLEDKLTALKEILDGRATAEKLAVLADDWLVESRCEEALSAWGLSGISLHQPLENLSGGQKTRVFLAGITIHRPEIILMDEPSNHLDSTGRELLYAFITSSNAAMVVVSHDRKLLRLLNPVFELSSRGITAYGGNYDFYAEQKQIASNALQLDILNKEKALRKAREVARETLERQQKLDARGRKKQEKAGIPTIALNTLRNQAEKSTAKTKEIHAEKTGGISKELSALRKALPDSGKMRFGFDHSALHPGKVLVSARQINHRYGHEPLWKEPLNITLTSGDRMAVRGPNGSGKSTLVNMLLGRLSPQEGNLQLAALKAVYIDQDYSRIDNRLSVMEQAWQYNTHALQEHEINIRLNRFLFGRDDWNKSCAALSGGEKMRLMLCCLTIGSHAPDLIVLDEPTNNLDLNSLRILTDALNEYDGTLLVISHDEQFLEEISIRESIVLGI